MKTLRLLWHHLAGKPLLCTKNQLLQRINISRNEVSYGQWLSTLSLHRLRHSTHELQWSCVLWNGCQWCCRTAGIRAIPNLMVNQWRLQFFHRRWAPHLKRRVWMSSTAPASPMSLCVAFVLVSTCVLDASATSDLTTSRSFPLLPSKITCHYCSKQLSLSIVSCSFDHHGSYQANRS